MDQGREGRECRSCDVRLAADNRGGVCGPCARRAADNSGSPPEVDDAFWDQVEIRESLDERHFGRFLRAYRKAQGVEITQADLARWLGLTQGQVSRIERAQTPIHDLGKLDRWASALGVPQRCLWFTLTSQSSDACSPVANGPTLRPSTDVEGDDVRRRRFLKSAGASAVVVGSTLLGGKPAYAASKRERGAVGADIEIREMTQRFRRLDNRYGGGHSRSVVSSYLSSIVEPQLKNASDDSGTRIALFTAAAEMHHLAG